MGQDQSGTESDCLATYDWCDGCGAIIIWWHGIFGHTALDSQPSLTGAYEATTFGVKTLHDRHRCQPKPKKARKR